MKTNKSDYKQNGGFLKLPRNLMSNPEISKMLEKEGASGLGLYISINLYLAHCEGGWGAYTGRQQSSLAVEMKKHRSDVRRIIEDYGLFVVDGERFTSCWIQQNYKKDGQKLVATRANLLIHAGDKEIDIEKENKENQGCVCAEATHPDVIDSTPVPSADMIGPSVYEYIDEQGLRHGKKGELVTWWASPQTDVYKQWSLVGDCWASPSTIEAGQEALKRQQMTDDDFKIATAYAKLDESEHYKIQDEAQRKM